jgi:hypothetical protein
VLRECIHVYALNSQRRNHQNKHCFVSFLEIKSSFPLSLHDLYQVQVFHLSRYLLSIYFSWVFVFVFFDLITVLLLVFLTLLLVGDFEF